MSDPQYADVFEQLLIAPVPEISNNVVCTTSKASD